MADPSFQLRGDPPGLLVLVLEDLLGLSTLSAPPCWVFLGFFSCPGPSVVNSGARTSHARTKSDAADQAALAACQESDLARAVAQMCSG
ncbi:hypothetical protein DNTS_008490 [Danionella cerebrum]|uniref:Uncharacterized protein n=1 Tax=Danionella cerebrum TaxID=2873325 RepID=A0A553MRI1_9TELE|nr:hypothetical protein DNTS_008490 [Danionella translucida]